MVVSALGYVEIRVSDPTAWIRMATDVFAMQVVEHNDGRIDLRIDDRPYRLALTPASSDGVAAIGWEVADATQLAALVECLRQHGVAVTQTDAKRRQVETLWSFTDPMTGLQSELYVGARSADTPFVPSRTIAGYETGTMGLGHIVLAVADRVAATSFYTDVMGFRISDYIDEGPLHATFMHCNARHHTLAIIDPLGPLSPGDVAHIMVEAKSTDDIGHAYDIVERDKYRVQMTMGKHSNDHTQSFYIYTPSGFAMEYGYGGRTIHDDWEVAHYPSTKIWGHWPVGAVA